jgi:iron(III) transport system substrate-binding protein
MPKVNALNSVSQGPVGGILKAMQSGTVVHSNCRVTHPVPSKKRTLLAVVATALAATATLTGFQPAAAQTNVPAPLLEGSDRMQRLIDGAKKEGTLTVYTSMAAKDDRRIVDAFEKKYGIKVNVWRSGKNIVLQRVVSEARAGRNQADFVLNPSPEMEALHREKLLQPVNSPVQRDLINAALPAHKEWTGMRVYVFVQAYNTDKVSATELPKTYEELADPRWKGRLGVEAKQQEWFYTLVTAMGEKKGLQLFRDLVQKNKMSHHNGNSLMVNMTVSGEVPFALGAYSYLVEQARASGTPVNYISLSPTIAYTDGIGVLKKAPHPYAATLYYDFVLTEGQKIVAENKAVTTNKQDAAILARYSPIFMDPPRVLDAYAKWGKLFDATLNGQ